jgi:hypothetical protein
MNGCFFSVRPKYNCEIRLVSILYRAPLLCRHVKMWSCTKSDLNVLDFTIKRFWMKLFKSVNIELINECRIMFGVKLPSKSIAERTKEFISFWQLTYQIVCRHKLTTSVHMYVYEGAPARVFLLSNLLFLFFKNNYHEIIRKVSYIMAYSSNAGCFHESFSNFNQRGIRLCKLLRVVATRKSIIFGESSKNCTEPVTRQTKNITNFLHTFCRTLCISMPRVTK